MAREMDPDVLRQLLTQPEPESSPPSGPTAAPEMVVARAGISD